MRLQSYKRRVARLERAMGFVPMEQEVTIHVAFVGAGPGPGYSILYEHCGQPNATREYVNDRTGEVSDSPPELPFYDRPDCNGRTSGLGA
jgi:hypothetical protein